MQHTKNLHPKECLKLLPSSAIDYIKSKIEDPYLAKHALKFIAKIIYTPKSMSVMFKKLRYSVIYYSRDIQANNDALIKLKDKGIPELIRLNLIERSNYIKPEKNKAGLCREYNLHPEFFLELLLLCLKKGECLELGKSERKDNFKSVKSLENNFLKERLKISQDFCFHSKIPVTNTVSIDAIPASPELSLSPYSPLHSVINYAFKNVVNIKNIEEYCVNKYKDLLLRKSKLVLKNPKRYRSELASIMSDYYKFISLYYKGITDSEGIFQYTKKFIVTSTGRLCEVNGGLQGLSRGCKTYIYNGIKDLHNYDIQNCQPTLLNYLAKKNNINTDWLEEYLNNSNSRKIMAREIGISEKTLKTTILSLIFGASGNRFGTPYSLIKKECGGNSFKTESCFEIWKEKTEGLRIICKLWLTRIRKFCRMLANKNDILENAAGMMISLKDSCVTKKFLSSFLLQGLESRIVSDLVLLKTKTFQPVSIEYDGLVTIKEITNENWKDVLNNLNLTSANLKLVEKPFN